MNRDGKPFSRSLGFFGVLAVAAFGFGVLAQHAPEWAETEQAAVGNTQSAALAASSFTDLWCSVRAFLLFPCNDIPPATSSTPTPAFA